MNFVPITTQVFPKGPAITAIFSDQDGLLYPKNYAAYALCSVAQVPALTRDRLPAIRQLGVAVEIKKQVVEIVK